MSIKNNKIWQTLYLNIYKAHAIYTNKKILIEINDRYYKRHKKYTNQPSLWKRRRGRQVSYFILARWQFSLFFLLFRRFFLLINFYDFIIEIHFHTKFNEKIKIFIKLRFAKSFKNSHVHTYMFEYIYYAHIHINKTHVYYIQVLCICAIIFNGFNLQCTMCVDVCVCVHMFLNMCVFCVLLIFNLVLHFLVCWNICKNVNILKHYLYENVQHFLLSTKFC